MEQQNTINQQISKQQQRNIYLSELLKNLEEKLSKAQGNNQKDIVIENRAELQIAQMKNLDKKIEIYKHQLQKLKDLNTSKVILELNTLKQELNKQWRILNDVKKELKTTEDEVSGFAQKNMTREKNKGMEKMFKQRQYEMKILAKKLKQLDNIEGNLNYKSPPKKSARSFTQIIKEKDSTLTAQPETQDKKSKIDKYAMYKNLIRFYKLQQEKLKGEIEKLTKDKQQIKMQKKNLQKKP